MPKQNLKATWNPERDYWEKEGATSEHSDVYSVTLPKWGMTLDGRLFELPMSALPTVAPESSSLPLLPTPVVNDMGRAYNPTTWDEWTERMKAKHKNGNGHGKSLNIEAQRMSLMASDQE